MKPRLPRIIMIVTPGLLLIAYAIYAACWVSAAENGGDAKPPRPTSFGQLLQPQINNLPIGVRQIITGEVLSVPSSTTLLADGTSFADVSTAEYCGAYWEFQCSSPPDVIVQSIWDHSIDKECQKDAKKTVYDSKPDTHDVHVEQTIAVVFRMTYDMRYNRQLLPSQHVVTYQLVKSVNLLSAAGGLIQVTRTDSGSRVQQWDYSVPQAPKGLEPLVKNGIKDAQKEGAQCAKRTLCALARK